MWLKKNKLNSIIVILALLFSSSSACSMENGDKQLRAHINPKLKYKIVKSSEPVKFGYASLPEPLLYSGYINFKSNNKDYR